RGDHCGIDRWPVVAVRSRFVPGGENLVRCDRGRRAYVARQEEPQLGRVDADGGREHTDVELEEGGAGGGHGETRGIAVQAGKARVIRKADESVIRRTEDGYADWAGKRRSTRPGKCQDDRGGTEASQRRAPRNEAMNSPLRADEDETSHVGRGRRATA